MNTKYGTIVRSRDFALPVEAVFTHWVNPEARRRWETGGGINMRYDAFDTRTGGQETVRIFNDEGAEIGHFIQHHRRVEKNRLLATTIEAVSTQGQVDMLSYVVVEFHPTDAGCRLEALSQVADITGRRNHAELERGWEQLLVRFQDDLETHGPMANAEETGS